MKRVLAIALAFIGSAMAAHAADVSATIVQYGLFTAEEVEPSTGRDGPTMRAAVLTNICHLMTTSIVPAGGGPGFGVRYRVLGSPFGMPVELTRVIKYPDPGKRGPTSSVVTNRQRVRVPIGEFDYFGWANRRHIPGIFTFQIWEQDHMRAETVFTAVDGRTFLVRPDGDSNCFLMSNLEGAMKWHWT